MADKKPNEEQASTTDEEPRPSTSKQDDQGDLAMLVGVSKKIANIAEQKAKMAKANNMATPQETFRVKMQKNKEKRMDRYAMLQMQQRHICDMVAIYLGIEATEVLEGVADELKYCMLLEEIVKEKGRCAIMFYYQDGAPPDIDSGRFNPQLPPNTTVKKIIVTNGSDVPLLGRAVLVYRVDNVKALEMKNVAEELNFAQFDLTQPNTSVVSEVFQLLITLTKPHLLVTKDWGDLSKTDAGKQTKDEFLGDFNSFLNFLETTIIDLESTVKFKVNTELFTQQMDNPNLIKLFTQKPEFLPQVESEVRLWVKQIEKVLTQFTQLRRENEFVGPMVEIEYWRRQLAMFTSIVEFIKSKECQVFLQTLILGKSKFLKTWKKFDNAVTDTKNECQDNVKYLYSMEKFCEPLYRSDPSVIINQIPSLLYTIRMIFTTSRYYNNTASVTAILVKVSNQMISACRKYLSNNGANKVWEQPMLQVMEKVKVCLDLYLKYYQCFKHIQHEMQNAGEPSFGCSEMYVFGKFETFKKRVEEIVDVLQTTVKYSILQSSTIEGIDYFANKFKTFYKKIASQKYDELNHRLDAFHKDYTEFKQSVIDTEWELEEFVGTSLEKMQSVDNVLRLLKRFDKLNLDCLHLDERYLEALEMFEKEIENLRDKYNEQRQNPAIPNNMPPVSGRIMWIRQFYKRIEEPMEIFKTRTKVMRHRKAQKCIQLYNALACVFVHYEQIYHKAWSQHVAQVRCGLSAPVLIKHPKTKRYVVNFDPYIAEAIREAEYIYKLGMSVPDVAQIIVFCKDRLLYSVEVIKALVERNDTIRKNIPKLFVQLMKCQLLKMENAFLPGFSAITWTSMKIPEFCDDITTTLDYIEMFVKEVSDMKEARIDEVLDSITSISLVYLPMEPVPPAELLSLNMKHRSKIAKEIELKSSTAETAVIELINKFMDTVPNPEFADKKYKWLDPDKAIRPVGSSSKLLMGDDAGLGAMQTSRKKLQEFIKCRLNFLQLPIFSIINEIMVWMNFTMVQFQLT